MNENCDIYCKLKKLFVQDRRCEHGTFGGAAVSSAAAAVPGHGHGHSGGSTSSDGAESDTSGLHDSESLEGGSAVPHISFIA